MLKNSFLSWLENLIKRRDLSLYDVRDILEQSGWELLSRGSESTVFHKKGVPFVIKLVRDPHEGMDSFKERLTARRLDVVEKLCAPYHFFEFNRFSMVSQEKMRRVGNFRPTMSRKEEKRHEAIMNKGRLAGLEDMIPDNVGMDARGRYVVIDWES